MTRRTSYTGMSNAKLKHLLLAGAVSLIAAAGAHFMPPAQKAGMPAAITGEPQITDGDTIKINGQRIRFYGVDAPETSQSCTGPQGTYRCGLEAKQQLTTLIAGQTVTCKVKDVDRYNRYVGQCFLGELDVNGWMAEHGWALAYRQYAQDYIPNEERAAAAHAGIWAGTFQKPWEYRHAKKDAEFSREE